MVVILKNEKIDRIKECLENLNSKKGINGCILCSEEGLVVISTKNNYKEDDFDSLAAMAATLLDIMNYEILSDIVISYDKRKIFLKKINGDICNLIFINVIASNQRYFKREVNKTIREISKLLTFN